MSEENLSQEVVNQEVMDNKPKKKKKEKSKTRKIVEWVLLGIFLLIFGTIAAGFIDGEVNKSKHYGKNISFGIGTFYVLTDSMEPDYKAKDAIITYLDDFNNIYNQFSKNSNAKIDITFMNCDAKVNFDENLFIHEEFKSINGGQEIVTNEVMTHRIMEIHLDETKKFGQGRFIIITSGINHGGLHSKIGQYQILTEKQYLGTVKFKSAFLGGVFGFVSTPWGLIVLLLIPAGYLIIAGAIDIFKALKESDEGEVVTENKESGLNKYSKEDLDRLESELMHQLLEEGKKEKDEQK